MAASLKRVLHVLNQFERSGAEMMLLQSAAHWRAHGYELDLLATGPEVGPLEPMLRSAGFGTHHIPFRSALRYLPSSNFVPQFLNLCRRGDYDVLHLHTEAAFLLFVTLGRSAQIPAIVRTVHSAFTFGGALALRKRFERTLARAAGVRFAFVSESVQQVEAEFYTNPGICTPNWFDVEHFRPPSDLERAQARQELDCPRDAFVLVTVGNCNQVKNHAALLDAIAMLQPSRPLVYLHVGREQPAQPERAHAASLGVDAHVRFLGSHADPRPFLWAADLFVMPSLYEGFGNAALEAVGSGTPSLFTKVRGLRDIAAKTRWVAQAELEPASIAAGLGEWLRVPAGLARERALADAAVIRGLYSIDTGVAHIVRSLYQDERELPADGASSMPTGAHAG